MPDSNQMFGKSRKDTPDFYCSDVVYYFKLSKTIILNLICVVYYYSKIKHIIMKKKIITTWRIETGQFS